MPCPTSPRANGVLVLVDGYSSGAQLPTVMRERGWACVHVESLAEPPAYYLATFRDEDYVARFTYDGDVDRLARDLAPHAPSAVLPGTESGVVVADLLAAALGLPGNDPATSIARRDKYEMHTRLERAGLRSMDHYLAQDLDGLLGWARSGSWPVVLKPRASAGTDSVTFCADEAELEEGFRRLHGARTQLGDRNEAVLAQRMLSGQEYFINGVSGAGRHRITEIWLAHKLPVPGAGLIYDRAVLFDPLDPAMQPIVGYVHAVLDALGVRYGANHTELMVTDDRPTLIECASRLSGGLNRGAAGYAVGASQIDLVARIAAEGEASIERISEELRGLRSPLWQVQFVSNQAGVVTRSSYEELMATLRSRTWLQKAPKPGDTVTRTTDLFSSPGLVFMSHEDTRVLERDYETIRRWERENRLFDVA